MSTNRIKDKVALITGATSGIGRACALSFAKYGAKLLLVARRTEQLENLKQELKSSCPEVEVFTYTVDVRNKEQVNDFFEAIPEPLKAIDILVNNAGLALGLEHTANSSMDNWEIMIDTNVKGVLYIAKAVLEQMYQRQMGHIINIGSIAGEFPYANGSVYCATKAAVHAFSRALREECIEKNIKISEIMPGAANTEFSSVRFQGDVNRANNVYQGFEPLLAEDIADLVTYTVNLPQHVNLAESIIMPTAQATIQKIYRKS